VNRSKFARVMPLSAVVLLPALALFGPVGCKEEVAGPTKVDTVVVAPNDIQLFVNGTQQVFAQVFDKGGKALTGRLVEFSSQDNTIATVSSAGLVVGVRIGTTHISAQSEGKFGSATVTVKRDDVANVSIDPPGGQVVVEREKRTITARVVSASNNPLTDRRVNWSTSNPLVAVVTSTGLQTAEVTAVKAGQVAINAEVEGRIASIPFQVTPSFIPVARVAITPAGPQVLRVGGKKTLTATAFDVDNNVLTGRPVSFFSTNPLVASVDPVSGQVTAIAPGTTSIVADIEQRTATTPVTVTLIPVSTVRISPRDLVVFESVNNSPVNTQLGLTVTDTTGAVISLANRSVGWSLTDLTVAGFLGGSTATPVLQASQPGTTYLKVIIDLLVSDSTLVTVKRRNVASVFIQQIGQQTIQLNDSRLFTAATLDSANIALPSRTITWAVSDSTIGSVNSLGLFTALKKGNVTLSATAEGKSDSRPVVIP
jgi:uncharacterized protein YjdB